MKVIGFDHLVVNTRNPDRALAFYRDVLGLEILREEEYRAGKVGFASVRESRRRPSSMCGRSTRTRSS